MTASLSHTPSRRAFLRQVAAGSLLTQVPVTLQAQAPRPPKPIRAAQIGTGHAHAAGKWKTLLRSEDFQMVGLTEPDPAWQFQLGKGDYAGAKVLEMEAILKDSTIQMVAVESRVEHLLDHAEACLEAGKHIHLDKPAGADWDHFKRVVTLARQQNRRLQMGYMFRYNPAFELCFRAVREGWLGKIFAVEAVMGKKSGDSTRQDLARFEGGTMFELGCHVIDAVVHLLGAPDKVHAFQRQTRSDDGLADNQLAVLEYPDVLATVRSALMDVDGFSRRQLVVCGEFGRLEIRPLEPPKVRLTLEKAAGGFDPGVHDIEVENTPRYVKDFQDLAQSIRSGEPLDFGYDHDLVVQETVLRASGMW